MSGPPPLLVAADAAKWRALRLVCSRRATNVLRPGIELMNIAAFCECGHLAVSMCSACVTRGR